MLGDVVRVLLDVRHDFVPLNAGSHVPVGPEDNVLDLLLKDRRLVAVRFSNDYILIERDGAIRIHGAYAILRKIYNHGRLWERMRNPAPPFERQLDLANTGRWWRIEFIDGARVKVAGGSFSMPVLIMFHALDERAIVDARIRIQPCAGWNVTDDLQKPSQAGHACVGLAGPYSLRDRW